MKWTYDFSYLACQSCTAKIHCDDCAAEVSRRLLAKGIARSCTVDMKTKMIEIDGSDEDDILDELDIMGVLI